MKVILRDGHVEENDAAGGDAGDADAVDADDDAGDGDAKMVHWTPWTWISDSWLGLDCADNTVTP